MNATTRTEWLYFGCHRQPGHYLFFEGMKQVYFRRDLEKLTHFDAMLPPQDSRDGYIATLSRLGGWGLTALAFWDYSVDSRGGCNSVFFAPSLTITAEEMVAGAAARFPEVWKRLPPITLKSGNG